MSRHTGVGDRPPSRRTPLHHTPVDANNDRLQETEPANFLSSGQSSDTQVLHVNHRSTASSQTSQIVIPLSLVMPEGGQSGDVSGSPPTGAGAAEAGAGSGAGAEAGAAGVEATGTAAPTPAPSHPPSPAPSRPQVSTTCSGSSQDVACRICQESTPPLYVWCDCKGTIGMAHKECLEEWIARSGATRCELCGYVYNTRRVARFPGRVASLRPWLSGNVMEQTALVADVLGALLCMAVSTVSAVVCCVGIRSAQLVANAASTTTSTTPTTTTTSDNGVTAAAPLPVLPIPPDRSRADVLFMQITCSITVMISVLWFVLAVRFHIRVWLRWWNQQFDVRVVPRSVGRLHKGAVQGGGGQEEAPCKTHGRQTPPSPPRPMTPPPPTPAPPSPRTATRAAPRQQQGALHPWRWLRRQQVRHVAARQAMPPWRPDRPATAARDIRRVLRSPPRVPVLPQRPVPPHRFASMQGSRYYTMMDAYHDWAPPTIPYSMLALPVDFPDVRNPSTVWRNQLAALATPMTRTHNFRLAPSNVHHRSPSLPSSIPMPSPPPPPPPPPPPLLPTSLHTQASTSTPVFVRSRTSPER